MGRRCAVERPPTADFPRSDALPVCFAVSLELKASKENAHSDYIRSVDFSPDGKTIVSGSDDRTIKVWDSVNFRPHVESEWESFSKTMEADDSDEEDEIETWWRNKVTGHEQNAKPSGGKQSPLNPTGRSKSAWDAGMQWAQKPPFTPPADASCLRTQPRSTW